MGWERWGRVRGVRRGDEAATVHSIGRRGPELFILGVTASLSRTHELSRNPSAAAEKSFCWSPPFLFIDIGRSSRGEVPSGQGHSPRWGRGERGIAGRFHGTTKAVRRVAMRDLNGGGVGVEGRPSQMR